MSETHGLVRKLNADRIWWLRQWTLGGWSIGNPMRCTIKKWKAHTDALVRDGFLERISANDHLTCRMTDAGRDYLESLEP